MIRTSFKRLSLNHLIVKILKKSSMEMRIISIDAIMAIESDMNFDSFKSAVFYNTCVSKISYRKIINNFFLVCGKWDFSGSEKRPSK